MSGAKIPWFELNNGVKIPSVLMGCYQGSFGKEAKGLEQAIKVGYRGLDTATMYQNEEAVGEAVRNSGLPRSEFFVTTKLSPMFDDRENVARSFQRSLDALNIEYIDLYLIHWPHGIKDGAMYNGKPVGSSFNEVWAEMEKLLDTGKVRAVGVSNFSIKTFEELFKTAKIVPAVNQVEGHPYLPDEELLEYSKKKGIHTSYYSPLGQGSELLQDPEIQAIAKNSTPGQVVLSWAVSKGISVNPRSTNEKRMKENITIAPLTPEEVARIDAIHKQPGKNRRMNIAAYNKETKTVMGEKGPTLEDLGWDVGFE